MVQKWLIGLLLFATIAFSAQQSQHDQQNVYNQQFEENLKKLDGLLQGLDSGNQVRSHQEQAAPHRHHHHHHQDKGANLMNVQNLNLVLKRNRQRKRAADKALRTLEKSVALEAEERMCELTGRCGCGRGRCGASRNKDSIEQLLDDIEKQISHNDSNRYDSQQLEQNDRADINDILENQKPLQRDNQKYSLGDDLDVVVLDLTSLDNLLGNSDSKSNIRSRNRILPMTLQQITRLHSQRQRNQQYRNNRRHLSMRNPRRALPFKLSGQGLGQIN